MLKQPIYKIQAEISQIAESSQTLLNVELVGMNVFPFKRAVPLFKAQLNTLSAAMQQDLRNNVNNANYQYNQFDKDHQTRSLVDHINYLVTLIALYKVKIDNKAILRAIQLADILLAELSESAKLNRLSSELEKITPDTKKHTDTLLSIKKKQTKQMSRMKAFELLIKPQPNPSLGNQTCT